MQIKIFEKYRQLVVPSGFSPALQLRLEESREIVQKAINDTDPYAICLMLSGGDDSVTAIMVAILLGVKIDFVIHGVTGTGLKDVRKYVHELTETHGLKLVEADAGKAFEGYVKRKGFFGERSRCPPV